MAMACTATAAALLLLQAAVTIPTTAASPATSTSTSSSPGTISWASHPVLPGEAVVLQGSFPTAAPCAVSVAVLPGRHTTQPATQTAQAVTLAPVQQTAVSLKVVLPDSLPVGAYEVRACGSEPVTINLADVWWLLGDQGDTASPGGWVRAFGRSISRADTWADRDALAARILDAARRRDHTQLRRLLPQESGAAPAAGAAATDVTLVLTADSEAAPAAALGSTRIAATVDDTLTPYSASFRLPADLPPGRYRVALVNDLSDVAAPFRGFLNETTPKWEHIDVRQPVRYSDRVFEVTAFGPMDRRCFNASVNVRPPSTWRCADAAVRAALRAAGEAGGGEVLLPRGQLYLEGPVAVPSGVHLRGASQALTSVYFRGVYRPGWVSDAPTPALLMRDPSSPAAPGPGLAWRLSNLTVYAMAWHPAVVYVAPGERFEMDRVRVRANAFFAQNGPTYRPEPNCSNSFLVHPTRGRYANYSASDNGAALHVHGRNVFVTNCDLYGTYNVITSAPRHHHTAASPIGMQFGLFENNRIWNGGASHLMPQWEQVAFRNNVITGVSPTAMGQSLGTSSAGAASHVFEGQNSIAHVWGNDRETLTYDDAGGAYWGTAVVRGATLVLDHDPLQSGASQFRVVAMILNGTGAHEYRRVVQPGGTGANDVRTWGLDGPFSAAVPDGTAVFVQIMPGRVQNLHVLNTYADGGAVQIYGHGTDVIIGHNTAERMTGFLAWGQWRGAPNLTASGPRGAASNERRSADGAKDGRPAGRVGGSFGVGMNPTTHLQILSNDIREGNNIVNIWYTNTSGTTGDYNPGPWLHGTGVANFLDQHCLAVVDGRVGFLTAADNPAGQYTNAFVILRRNRVESNGGVWVSGRSRDVLVENTAIAASDHGVTVDNTTTSVLVRPLAKPP